MLRTRPVIAVEPTLAVGQLRLQAGYTLVELVAVLVVIGILSAVALPRLSMLGFDEAGYRDQMAAALSYARKMAVAQRRNVQVTRDGNVLSFRIANNIPESAAGLDFAGAAARDLEVPGTGAAQISPRRSSTTMGGPATLVFGPLGVASVASAASHTYTIGGGTSYTVTVDPLTGYVY